MPFAHDFGLLFEVWEYEGHIAIHASWDHELVGENFVGRLVEGFGRVLLLVGKMDGRKTVGELMADGGGTEAGLE